MTVVAEDVRILVERLDAVLFAVVLSATTKTATRSCRTRKRALHVYSPGVVAAQSGPPPSPLLTLLRTANFPIKS